MGACASRPKDCVGLSSRKKKKNNGKPRIKRRRVIKRRVSSRNIEKADFTAQTDRSYTNPTLQGWFFEIKLAFVALILFNIIFFIWVF